MSVTFNLYKVNNDVDYTGDIFDFIKPSDWASGASDDILKKHGEPEYLESKDEEAFQKYIEDYNNWQNEIESSAWSDGNKHEMIDITHLKQVNGECRGFNRLCRKLKTLPYKKFNNGFNTKLYIPVDSVYYAQGWFLRKRFFNKEITYNVCTSIKEVRAFFKKYGIGVDAANVLSNVEKLWEDNTVFIVSW